MADRKDKSKGKSRGERKRPDDGSESFGDSIRMGKEGINMARGAGAVGFGLLAMSFMLGMSRGDHFKQFMYSYLTAFMWTLAIVAGALWWVTLQNLVNAKWSIVVRRIGEVVALAMPLLIVLALPIVYTVLVHSDVLYAWLNHDYMHSNHALHGKMGYLNATFFAVRVLVYFAFWTVLARFFFKKSIEQDSSKEPRAAVGAMAKISAPSMIFFALTLTFCAIDFMMSLDPLWFSTIFGVYYFASCVLAAHSFMALSLMWLQSKGRLVKSVTAEHYHDLGKMMFAFTIFWAYIGFSQFMLIYYANIPEETFWYKARLHGSWADVSILLVVAHFVIPFFGLMSRHVKRNKRALGFWAIWILVVVWLDMHWLVMPRLHPEGASLDILDFTTWFGMASWLVAAVAFAASKVNLVPTQDPRLPKSLAFENI